MLCQEAKVQVLFTSGPCKTWMLDDWTNLAKNLDDLGKNYAISGRFSEKYGRQFAKTGLEKPGLVNYGHHFGHPLQNMVA